jgi:hypothetical protein
VSIVGRAVIADVTSSAENNGTTMNKVADIFVRLERRGSIVAVIPMMETRPGKPTKEFWQYRAAPSLHRPRQHTLREPGPNARIGYSVRADETCHARERESPKLISARKS